MTCGRGGFSGTAKNPPSAGASWGGSWGGPRSGALPMGEHREFPPNGLLPLPLRRLCPGGVTLGAGVSQPAPRRGRARAGNVLLVVLVTALQVAAPRSGTPGHVPDLLAGLAGAILGAAAALIQGVTLLWRRSRPVSVLGVCVAGYAVNAAVVPGVAPYAGWVAMYAAGVYGRG